MSSFPVTQNLNRWMEGDHEALEKLFPLIYGDLKLYAKSWSSQHSNESYVSRGVIKLIELRNGRTFKSRREFFSYWRQIMNRMRIDDFRTANRLKNNPNAQTNAQKEQAQNQEDKELDAVGDPRLSAAPQVQPPLPLEACSAGEEFVDLTNLEKALGELKSKRSRAYRVASMRFNGFKQNDIAEELRISVRVVRDELNFAKQFLLSYFQEERYVW